MQYIHAKTLLTRTPGAWFGIDYTCNLYRGCCHGCIYCDSRSDCYRIEEFDTVHAKANALQLLREELRAKRSPGVVGLGSMSDPYNPFERTECLTHGALELFAEYGFGVAIATKGVDAVRDLGLLRRIRTHAPVLVKVTVTTVDDALARRVEPHAPPPSERLKAVRALSDGGIDTGILMLPVLPFLEDTEENLLGVLRAASENGAKFVYAMFGMTLRGNQRAYYYRQLDELFPGLRGRYVHAYGENYECFSPHWRRLRALYEAECTRLGLLWRMEDIIRAYRSPYEPDQQRLF